MQFEKMKNLLTFLAISLLSNFGIAQTIYNTESKDSTNIYTNSLAKLCDITDHTKMDSPIFYVEKTLFTDNLPDKIQDFKIEYLNESEQIEMIKKKDGKMILIRIVPLRVRNGTFFVNVIPFQAYYHKKRLELANGGGMKVEYKFDSELNGLTFVKAEFNGI